MIKNMLNLAARQRFKNINTDELNELLEKALFENVNITINDAFNLSDLIRVGVSILQKEFKNEKSSDI